MAVVEHRFRVMASEAHLILVDPEPDAVALAMGRLDELEQRWSRFLPDSDISRLARANGDSCVVSPATRWLLDAMIAAHRLTAGRFDPTMLREIIDAGYDRSLTDRARRSITIDLPHPMATIEDVELDGCTVRLPEGMALDPGGIGKGFAADLVSTELVHRGTPGALVSIGGDLSAVGRPPEPEGWRVTIEDPFSPAAELTTLALNAGGVATSSTLSRSWQRGGRRRHHVLDPETGTSSTTDLATVTVFAPSAWEAEVQATAAIVQGRDGAIAHLEGRGLSGVAVTSAGQFVATGDLAGASPAKAAVAGAVEL